MAQEREEASRGTGLITWDGAIVLAKYLETHPTIVHGKSVLELGAGTGVAGIAAVLLGASSALLTGTVRTNVPTFLAVCILSRSIDTALFYVQLLSPSKLSAACVFDASSFRSRVRTGQLEGQR